MSSTSRFRFVNKPVAAATGTQAVQIAFAFQVNFNLRGAPGRTVTGTDKAAVQIGGAASSAGSGPKRLPANTAGASPSEPSAAAAPVARRIRRRDAMAGRETIVMKYFP